MFKEEYRREMNKIAPDSSFLSNLADKMEQESLRSAGSRKRASDISKAGNKIFTWGSLAAAAVFCIGISLFLWQKRSIRADFSDASMMKENAGGTLEQEVTGESMFGGSSWYGEEQDAAKIFSILKDKISEDADLKITCSAEENFEGAREISTADKESWEEQLAGARYLGSLEECRSYIKGAPVYYLLEFEDGLVIKCAVYDDRYFYCKEIDGIFDLKG